MREGWEMKKLGDLVNIKTGKLDSNAMIEGGKYPFFTCSREIFAIDDYAFDCEAILLAGNNASGDFNVKHYKGKFNAYQRTYVITIKEGNKILYSYLNQQLINHLKKFKEQSVGANTKFLKIGMIQGMEIALPPLEEQQRIVAILDEAFAAIAKAKANAEQNLKNAKELFESYLQGVFGSGNWKTKTIEEVCVELFAGGDVPKDNFSKEKNRKYNIPIIANAVKDNGLYGYTNIARVIKPSITIAARGSGTGHTEIRSEAYFPIVRLIVLIPNESLITLEFLKYSISTLKILRSGSAIPQLTIPMIKEYNLQLPPLKAQQAIVKKLDALSAETKKLEAIYQKKTEDLEELKKAFLEKAFRGELSEQDFRGLEEDRIRRKAVVV
jgi:type I restriction enzyme, S subunit